MNRPSEEQIVALYPRLYRTAMRLTSSREDSSDLTQQAFCKALNNWGQFDGKCRPATWLHGILVNCVRDWYRKKASRTIESLEEWHLPHGVLERDYVAEKLGRQEQLDHLRLAIEGLPDNLRVAFIAAVIDGYTYREVAEMLAVPEGTVAHRVYQARQNLRSVMLKTFSEK